MPWQERANFIKDAYNIDVCEKTLRNWCNKLMITETIGKFESEKEYWRTITIDGEKTRDPITKDEALEYYAKRRALAASYIAEAIAAGATDYKKVKSEAFTKANREIYSSYGYCYSCKTLSLAAFDKTTKAQEVYDLVNEITKE